MSSLVSIIIPCYNQGQFLGEAIESVLDQDYQRKEIIVVNDGSTDNTRKVAERFLHAIKYIEQQNRGVSSARNEAIRIANGDYIAFLDSDDVLLRGSLVKRAQYLNDHPDTSLVCSDVIIFNESGSLGLRSKLWKKPINHKNFRWETVDYDPTPSSVMVLRSCLDKVGLFEESLRSAEDWLMWIRISLYYNMAYLDTPLTKYRLHSSNVTKGIRLDNVGHRTAISQIVNAPYFDDYPAHFRAQLLFLRFASVWRFQPKQSAYNYFLRAVKTDPSQIGFGLKVILRGVNNIFRRHLLKS